MEFFISSLNVLYEAMPQRGQGRGNLGGENADVCCGTHASPYKRAASFFAAGQAEGAPVAPFINVLTKNESQLPKYFHIRFEAAICDHEWLAAPHIRHP